MRRAARIALPLILAWAGLAAAAGPTVRVSLGGSRSSIHFECFAPDGSPAPILGFAGLDEVQSLATGAGVPAAQGCALTVGGATTAPIPWHRVPPSTAFVFRATLPAAGRYDVQVCAPAIAGLSNAYQVVDGALPAGPPNTLDLGGQGPPAYADAATGTAFRSIGARAFATTAASVEVTAAPGAWIQVSAVRLAPAGGGPAILVPFDAAANQAWKTDRGPFPPSSLASQSIYSNCYPPGAAYFPADSAYPSAQPASYYLDPAEVAAAIAALPGFGPGSVAAASAFAIGPAAGTGRPTPPAPRSITLAFAGPKAAAASGPIASSDPLAAVAIAHPGGLAIRYNRAGATLAIPPSACTIGPAAVGPQSYFLAPFSPPLAPGESITIDAPAGAIRTAAGDSPALVAAPAAPWAAPAGPTPAIPVGFNFAQASPYQGVPLYRNWAQNCPSAGPYDGVPVMLQPADRAGVPRRAGPDDPAGSWTATWSGTDPVTIRCQPRSGPTLPTPVKVASPGVGTFSISPDPNWPNPEIRVGIPAGTTLTGIYGPGHYPPATTIHPDALRVLAATSAGRALDWTGAAFSESRTWADVNAVGRVGRYGNTPVRVAVASIAADDSGGYDAAFGPAIAVATAAPHGLAPDLTTVRVLAGPGGFGPAKWARAGSPYAGDQYGLDAVPAGFMIGLARATSPTTFTFQLVSNPAGDPARAGVTLAAPLAVDGATLNYDRTPAIPVDDQVAMIRDIQAARPGYRAHVSIPALLDDDGVKSYALAYLKVANRIRLEYSNEPWNSWNPTSAQLAANAPNLGLPAGRDWLPPYMARGGQVAKIWRDAFAAAGRPGDVEWVVNCNGFDPGGTAARMAAFAAANGLRPDDFALAPYVRVEVPSDPNPPRSADLASLYAGMTDGQCLDLAALCNEYNPGPACLAGVRAAIDAAGLKRADGSPVSLSCYESGYDNYVPGAPTLGVLGDPAAFWARFYRLAADPRWCGIQYRYLQLLQAGGAGWVTDYLHANNDPWAKLLSYGQPIGTGSASDPAGSAQVAGGILRFAADASPAPAPPPPAPGAASPIAPGVYTLPGPGGSTYRIEIRSEPPPTPAPAPAPRPDPAPARAA